MLLSLSKDKNTSDKSSYEKLFENCFVLLYAIENATNRKETIQSRLRFIVDDDCTMFSF